MRDPFNTKYPSKPHLVSGDLLNKYGQTLNAITGVRPGQVGQNQITDQQHQITPPPPWMQGIATITDDGNTCAETENVNGYKEIDAPCVKEATGEEGSSNKYVCQFKYWDFAAPVKQDPPSDPDAPKEPEEVQGAWRILHDIRMDASAYWEGNPGDKGVKVGQEYPTDASQSPSSGVGYGAIPIYRVGDNVPCYWDPQRKWLVPIQSPPQPVGRLLVKSEDEVPLNTCECLQSFGYTEEFLTVKLRGVEDKGLDVLGNEINENEHAFCDCEVEPGSSCETWNQDWQLWHVPLDDRGNRINDNNECNYILVQEGYDGFISGLGNGQQKIPDSVPRANFPCARFGDATWIHVKLRCSVDPGADDDEPYEVLRISEFVIRMKDCKLATWSFPITDNSGRGYQEIFSGDYVVDAEQVTASDLGDHPACDVDVEDSEGISRSACCDVDYDGSFCNARIPPQFHDKDIPVDVGQNRGFGAISFPHPSEMDPPLPYDNNWVLDAFYDFTNCKWTTKQATFPRIIIPRPDPLDEVLNDDSPFQAACENTASVFLEIREPIKNSSGDWVPSTNDNDWKLASVLHYILPEDFRTRWCDSRSNFNTILARHNTELRVTWTFRVGAGALLDASDYEAINRQLRTKDTLLEFTDAGPYSKNVRDLKACYDKVVRTKRLKKNWIECAEVEGRFRDGVQVVVPESSDDGVFKIQYEDQQDQSWVGVRLSSILQVTVIIEAAGPPPQADESSSSSSTSSKSTSSQSTSSVSSTSSSQSQESWSSQSSLSSTSSSSSSNSSVSSQSSQSSQSREVSLGTNVDDDYCCVEVVSNIECNPDGTISNVCKKVICFPKIDGVSCDDQIKPEDCDDCDLDISSESAISSSSSSSSSQSISESSTSTSSKDFICPDFVIEDEIDEITTTPTMPVTTLVVRPLGATSIAHWGKAFLNNSVIMSVVSTTGAGTIQLNENNGELTYIPPQDGSEENQDITITVNVCDNPPGTELSDSSISSSSTSSISTSLSSTSSGSSSSSSSSSSDLSEGSSSSSSPSSSSISSSTVSSASSQSSLSSTSSTSEVSASSQSSSLSSESSLSASSSSVSSSSLSSSSVSSSSVSSLSSQSSLSSESSVSSVSSSLSSASSTSTSSLSAISSVSSLSTSSLSSTSSISESSSSSVSSGAGDGCPECAFCATEATDCEIKLRPQGGLNFGPGQNHSNFTDETLTEHEGGVFKVELYWKKGLTPQPLAETSIAFSDAADLAAKLEVWLTSGDGVFEGLGGIWSVTASGSPHVKITDISSTNATYVITTISFGPDDGAGLFTDHYFDTASYQDPFIAETLNVMPAEITLTGLSICYFEKEYALVTGSGTGALLLTLDIQVAKLVATMEIYDNEDLLVASVNYELDGADWQCDRRYEIDKVSSYSIKGPTNGGPLIADACNGGVADWCGEGVIIMNNLSGPPV